MESRVLQSQRQKSLQIKRFQLSRGRRSKEVMGHFVRSLSVGALQGEITGPQDGLHYKWFSIAGECDPQESAAPTTKFQFGDGSSRDRVTLEVWREDRRVAHSEIDVTLSKEQMRLAMERESNVKIRITDVPPYDRYGGVDTRASIGDLVSGSFGPNCKVVVYTRVLDT